MSARRLNSLTGLRALAALAVFSTHAVTDPDWEWLVGQAAIGVSFFFVLSGFVLMWVYDPDEVGFRRRFFRHRFARLFPVYIFTWLVGVAVVVWSEGGAFEPAKVAAGALGLQAWVPDVAWYFAYNTPAWTLSVELFFYLSFPLWATTVLLLAKSRRRWLMAALVAAVFMIGGATELHYPYSLTTWPDNSAVEWFARINPAARLLEFLLGACLAAEMRAGVRAPLRLGPALLLAAAAYGLMSVWFTRLGIVAITLVPFLLVVAAAAQADLDGRASLFARRWAVRLGELSFAFYLVHDLVVRVLHWHLEMPLGPLIALELMISLAAAAAVHELLGRPLDRRLRGSSKPSERAAPKPPMDPAPEAA